ncbi:MAG: hypothetical protein OEV66_12825 [Spirochaetia bacterium]|nr:hypothetical protein [Spirochaetia bacterium]
MAAYPANILFAGLITVGAGTNFCSVKGKIFVSLNQANVVGKVDALGK